MPLQPLVARQVHSSKSTQASFAVSTAASKGAQIGQPHGLGFGTMPPAHAMAGHAMGRQTGASGELASTGTQVGQPQGGVTVW
jgi:hypothetical protein